ncbi:MAG: hypothetical protein V4482_02145 [Pseudomonadota bacterium]
MTKTYSCADDLPKENKPCFLHARNAVAIPSPAFDLTKHPLFQKFEPNVERQWAGAEKSNSLFIAHAISFASQRRVLDAYYRDANTLSAEQLILYAPFTVLAVRQLISGSLIDIKSKTESSLITRNGMGLLFNVPPSCIYVVSPVDANVPMEKEGVSQQQFRDELFGINVQQKNELCRPFIQSPIVLSPTELLSMTKGDRNNESYNEIAFVPRTLNPVKSIKLAGIFIDPDNSDFGRQEEKGDIKLASFYFDRMLKLAQMLELPFVNLQDMRGE